MGTGDGFHRTWAYKPSKKKQQQLGVRNAVKPVVLQLTSGFGDGGYQLNQVFFLLVTPGV